MAGWMESLQFRVDSDLTFPQQNVILHDAESHPMPSQTMIPLMRDSVVMALQDIVMNLDQFTCCMAPTERRKTGVMTEGSFTAAIWVSLSHAAMQILMHGTQVDEPLDDTIQRRAMHQQFLKYGHWN